MHKKGFTLIEMLVVIAILAILSAILYPKFLGTKEKAYYARTLSEYDSMRVALEMYKVDHGGAYPPDVDRDVPPGLGAYLAGNTISSWPDAPWPGSVYDWENWQDPDNADKRIYQISIRFCPAGGTLSQCKFPNESWAANFGVNSSVYYCIKGACRSHINEAITYPGYCVNCN